MKWTRANTKSIPKSGIVNVKVTSKISGVVALGVGLCYQGEITLITFLNKSTIADKEIDYSEVEYLDETPTPESRWPTEVIEKLDKRLESLVNYLYQNFSECGLANAASKSESVVYLLKLDLLSIFRTSAGTREADLEKCLGEAMSLKGGWREAITELEDFCSEPVRLKNMIAAADQLDEWAAKAKKLLNPDKEKPSIAGDLYSGA